MPGGEKKQDLRLAMLAFSLTADLLRWRWREREKDWQWLCVFDIMRLTSKCEVHQWAAPYA